jgi:6-phosphogluconolactonase
MAPEIVVVDGAGFARAVALRIARELERALGARGTASLALPAGPQIRGCYEAIAELALPWSEVDFFFADERCVPSEHPASAFGPAAHLLFSKPRIGLDNVYRIEGERPDHEAVAREYETRLPERLDVLVLELGLDGHVAGLFPGSSALAERERRVAVVEAPQKPRQRITLTARELEAAREPIVLATGRDRAVIVRRALREAGPVEELPARLALRGTWILDRAAASALEPGGP